MSVKKRKKILSMKDTIIPRKLNKNKAVVARLVHVNKLSKELHDLTTHEAIGKLLGVKRQAVAYHANKEENSE